MKKRSINKWAQGISAGILATMLLLMCRCSNSVQTNETESVTLGRYIDESNKNTFDGENCEIFLPQGVKLEMIWIKPGTFTMGSPEDELGRDDSEIQHQVTLTKGYWLGKYEVTQAQYKAVMGNNPSAFKSDDLPVEFVSWENAMVFCMKLNAQEKAAGRLPSGYEYTLPTEAQWEYACRAGTTTSLNSGKSVTSAEKGEKGVCDNLDEIGWYWMNGGMKNWNGGNDPAICTHPGGQKKPNNWGLYDMHGNVCEWCLDWASEYPSGSVSDPKGPDTGKTRVARGGGWANEPHNCRSAFRFWNTPDFQCIYLGFRVALAPVK